MISLSQTFLLTQQKLIHYGYSALQCYALAKEMDQKNVIYYFSLTFHK